VRCALCVRRGLTSTMVVVAGALPHSVGPVLADKDPFVEDIPCRLSLVKVVSARVGAATSAAAAAAASATSSHASTASSAAAAAAAAAAAKLASGCES
jgi:hypothetical protein